MKIAIGADHRGFEQKNIILQKLADASYEFLDVGTYSNERTDYPIYAEKVVQLMHEGQAQAGILLCGNGIGMALAANRHPQIYAGVAWNVQIAQKAKEHDNVNVLVIPSDYVSEEQLIPLIKSWLDAHFNNGRYAERIKMIDNE